MAWQLCNKGCAQTYTTSALNEFSYTTQEGADCCTTCECDPDHSFCIEGCVELEADAAAACEYACCKQQCSCVNHCWKHSLNTRYGKGGKNKFYVVAFSGYKIPARYAGYLWRVRMVISTNPKSCICSEGEALEPITDNSFLSSGFIVSHYSVVDHFGELYDSDKAKSVYCCGCVNVGGYLVDKDHEVVVIIDTDTVAIGMTPFKENVTVRFYLELGGVNDFIQTDEKEEAGGNEYRRYEVFSVPPPCSVGASFCSIETPPDYGIYWPFYLTDTIEGSYVAISCSGDKWKGTNQRLPHKTVVVNSLSSLTEGLWRNRELPEDPEVVSMAYDLLDEDYYACLDTCDQRYDERLGYYTLAGSSLKPNKASFANTILAKRSERKNRMINNTAALITITLKSKEELLELFSDKEYLDSMLEKFLPIREHFDLNNAYWADALCDLSNLFNLYTSRAGDFSKENSFQLPFSTAIVEEFLKEIQQKKTDAGCSACERNSIYKKYNTMLINLILQNTPPHQFRITIRIIVSLSALLSILTTKGV